MKVGNLVRLKNKINHELGVYPSGIIGIVIRTKEPSPKHPGAYADVSFKCGTITCHWRELEVVSESR